MTEQERAAKIAAIDAAITATETRLNQGTAVASYGAAGRNYSFRTLEEQRKHLAWLKAERAKLDGTSGPFSYYHAGRV